MHGETIARLTNDADPYFKNFSRIRVYKLPGTPGKLEKEDYEEGVLIKSNEVVMAGKEYHRFTHGPNERYLVEFAYQDHGRLSGRA